MSGTLEDSSVSQIRATMETNFFGPVRATKALLPYMHARRSGLIVNIGSSVGLQAVPVLGAYSASKFALEGISEALVGEVGDLGMGMLMVELGAMGSRFFF